MRIIRDGVGLLGVLVVLAICAYPVKVVVDQVAILYAESEADLARWGTGPAFGVLAALVFWVLVVAVAVVRARRRAC